MLFFQPLDQFDLYLINSLSNQNIFIIFFNFLMLNKAALIELILINLVVYLILLVCIIYIFTTSILMKRLKLIYRTLWQYVYENFIYLFPLNLIVAQVGKRGQEFLIYVATLYFFILLSNFIGLIPYSFTKTSHIILTFMFGASTIIGLTFIGFLRQKLNFLNLFVPRGVPKILLPMLISIEVISYIARGFSLSIRLFANLMAGHSLIHILMFFIIKILNFNYLVGFIGLFLITIIFILEIGIAFLQAYVFMVLVAIYLKDTYEVGH